jgi:nicotinamide mononucleotide (NMN) deamidase PncC
MRSELPSCGQGMFSSKMIAIRDVSRWFSDARNRI